MRFEENMKRLVNNLDRLRNPKPKKLTSIQETLRTLRNDPYRVIDPKCQVKGKEPLKEEEEALPEATLSDILIEGQVRDRI